MSTTPKQEKSLLEDLAVPFAITIIGLASVVALALLYENEQKKGEARDEEYDIENYDLMNRPLIKRG